MCAWSNERICHIVSGGDFRPGPFAPRPGDLVIAADGGFRHLAGLGRLPDLLLGDFDSLEELPAGVPTLRLPVEKDDTDTLSAVRIGLERGYGRFLLHGALGGARLDHTIANLQTLLFLTLRGARGVLLGGDDTVLTALHNDTLRFPPSQRGTLSVFCVGERAEGVRLSGVRYPLDGAVLTHEFPLGVSNCFTGSPAAVGVERGSLLLLWHEEGFSPRFFDREKGKPRR